MRGERERERESKGTERNRENGTEWNGWSGMERERNGMERNGTERNGMEWNGVEADGEAGGRRWSEEEEERR